MPRRHTFLGGCHCHNLELRFETDKSPAELGLRTDTCSFCAKHSSKYTSDPDGELHISFRDADRVQRYRFGTMTADFLVCTACGVFVAAYMPEPGIAVINVNVLDARAELLANELAVADLDGETLEQRLARRAARWTPVRSFGPAEGSASDHL